MLTYKDFRDKIRDTLKRGSLTWTEIRTIAKLPQKSPNNKWVHQMEKDIGLKRSKDDHGILRWKLQCSDAKLGCATGQSTQPPKRPG